MKFWPYKVIRADRHGELVDAEGALTVALAETIAMEKARDTAFSERDDALSGLEMIELELEGKRRELESLGRLLDQATHGAASIHVLLSNGEAISAHRTKGGAMAAARLRYGVCENDWSQGEGHAPTAGHVISTIPLAADTADTDTKAATV
ncbi:hypothetical protein [Streptomyces goshikiensis]|uniref:hypothetical protein n=1 Tax=Streptomyces goshikiensis TaxID=1942 RepID=UPI0022F3D589|nr:hypothetical protein [Streptomyces goshikiensis]WBY25141.1 hypothetical protein PET44_36165 [Streptomyces goshikiensis]